jgi:Flp pilus assembly pilin Flp
MGSAFLKRFWHEEDGQAMVEYLLLLTAMIGVVGALRAGLKDTTARLWAMFAKKVVAGCASCDPGGEIP